ncbi:uncharacterized protein SI:DKEY-261L7.2 [Latimeria chalumnae]|uniref:uncharacterized protein SI:DKEY-261L7.2 n=1 Tax=Latimeria chalumnae TaxID=7897 RepID=UPI0006D91B7E|nr:PREDICTED: uncharacterized protein LOC102364054 [Latimeria chalumnae]|eukprot:XP_014350013.1 PREDICTED: uncharacterized protein LOC102364054 [Latimeria chalumnae]
MPQINAAAALQICLILSALPAQYLISQWSGTNANQRFHATKRLISSWNNFRKSYFSLDAWTEWLTQWISKARFWHNEDDVQGESPAFEVLLFKERTGFFAESPHVRSPKPAAVGYRVGQVFINKRYGYIGVIVGWDATAKAPEEWLRQTYPLHSQDLRDTPHYKVLIDIANKGKTLSTYIPEQDIEIIAGLQIQNPTLETYFSDFNGVQYTMKPWLRKIYPHD